MKSWKLVFVVFLLFIFVFFTVVVGGESITEWFEDGSGRNLMRFWTYILFTFIVLLIVCVQRRKRICVPLSTKTTSLPRSRTNLGNFHIDGPNAIMEVFKMEHLSFKGEFVEYYARMVIPQEEPLTIPECINSDLKIPDSVEREFKVRGVETNTYPTF